jgi:hypothetical protein
MDQDTIDDLKQFIAATIRQQTVDMTTKDDLKTLATKDDLVRLDQKLTAKIDDLQTSVSEALDTSNEAVDNQLKDHETRLTALETKPA